MRLNVVNADTGEICLSWTALDVEPEPMRPFIRVGSEYLLRAAMNAKLPLQDRLWVFLMAQATWRNKIEVPISTLAEVWGVSRKTVSRALARLVELDLVERVSGPQESRQYVRFHPFDCSRGKNGKGDA